MTPLAYTPQSFAKLTSLDLPTVYKPIREGELGAVKVGRRYLISHERASEFLNRSGHISTNQIKKAA